MTEAPENPSSPTPSSSENKRGNTGPSNSAERTVFDRGDHSRESISQYCQSCSYYFKSHLWPNRILRIPQMKGWRSALRIQQGTNAGTSYKRVHGTAFWIGVGHCAAFVSPHVSKSKKASGLSRFVLDVMASICCTAIWALGRRGGVETWDRGMFTLVYYQVSPNKNLRRLEIQRREND